MSAPSYLALVAGVVTNEQASTANNPNVIVATDATGRISVGQLPTGVGPDVAGVTASEALAAGAMVNLWNNAGVVSARNANAATGLPAHGYVLAAVASSGVAQVYMDSFNSSASSSVATTANIGKTLYLDVTAGAVSVTPPSTAGQILQPVGFVIAANMMQFNWQPFIQL